MEALLPFVQCDIGEASESDESKVFVCLIDPGKFKEIDQLVSDITRLIGLLQALNFKEMKEDEEVII